MANKELLLNVADRIRIAVEDGYPPPRDQLIDWFEIIENVAQDLDEPIRSEVASKDVHPPSRRYHALRNLKVSPS